MATAHCSGRAVTSLLLLPLLVVLTCSGAGATLFPVSANLNVRIAPNLSVPVLRVVLRGSSVDVVCQTIGETVCSTNDIWDKLTDGSFVSDGYVNTGTNSFSPLLPRCPGPYLRTPPRDLVVSYADHYCLTPNTAFPLYTDADSSNFASQALNAGGIPQDAEWGCTGTISCTVAWYNGPGLYSYLLRHNLGRDCTLAELQMGDLIQYSLYAGWSLTVVVVVPDATNPVVDYHSDNQCNVLHNSILFNYYRAICISYPA